MNISYTVRLSSNGRAVSILLVESLKKTKRICCLPLQARHHLSWLINHHMFYIYGFQKEKKNHTKVTHIFLNHCGVSLLIGGLDSASDFSKDLKFTNVKLLQPEKPEYVWKQFKHFFGHPCFLTLRQILKLWHNWRKF